MLKEMQHKFMTLIIAALVLQSFSSATPATPRYVKTGECESAQRCHYFYTAHQQYFGGSDKGNIGINAEIDITCISSGIHNETSAKLYCMDIQSATISGSILQNTTNKEKRGIQKSMTKLLSKWFCFVQNSHGKIAAVYHSTSENVQAVTFKKGVAAAFQANFDDTEEEEEMDPGSTHTSHYIHIPTEEGKKKMRRIIHSRDVHELASSAPKKDVEMEKDEEIEYKSGQLVHSAGNMTVRLVNESDVTQNDMTFTAMFSASGWYDLELRSCHNITSYMFGIEKKKINSNMRTSMEEDLKATVDERDEALQEMRLLREKLPSGSVTLALRQYRGDEESDKLVEKLKRLVELEAEYGVQPSHTSAIDEILAFMRQITKKDSDKKLREAVFMLLSTDGSFRSQMALLNALNNTNDSLEANSILTHISFLDWASLDLVVGLEDHLHNPNVNFNANISDQLLLVYGSLATKGSEEVEDRVMNYLNTVSLSIDSQTDFDLSQSILVVHALGNTGSESSLTVILSFLNQSELHSESKEIKLAVIDALGKLTEKDTVLTVLEEFLVLWTSDSEEYVAAVIETLDHGFEYVESRQQQVDEYITYLTSHTILYSIVRVSASINSTDLHVMVVEYFKKIDSKDLLFEILEREITIPGGRVKRQTSDWDSSSRSDYDLVASFSIRRSDVNNYPRHKAYITSKTIGISKANIKVASGYFAGTDTHCDQMKAFTRGIVRGTVLSRSVTLADLKLQVTATTKSISIPKFATNTSISILLYARVGTNTLLNFGFNEELLSHCRTDSQPLGRYRRTLFRFSIPIPVFGIPLRISIALNGQLDINFNSNICIGRTGTAVSGALGALTFTLGVTIEGSVSVSLMVARAGLSVEAIFNYQMEPTAGVHACKACCRFSARSCIGILDSRPDNRIELYAWYQIRKPRICHRRIGLPWGGSIRIPYPCFSWGSRSRFSPLSTSWSLPSRGRRPVIQSCTGSLNPRCIVGTLNSPLFPATSPILSQTCEVTPPPVTDTSTPETTIPTTETSIPTTEESFILTSETSIPTTETSIPTTKTFIPITKTFSTVETTSKTFENTFETTRPTTASTTTKATTKTSTSTTEKISAKIPTTKTSTSTPRTAIPSPETNTPDFEITTPNSEAMTAATVTTTKASETTTKIVPKTTGYPIVIIPQ